VGAAQHRGVGGKQGVPGEQFGGRESGDLPIRLLSDDHFANAHRFHSNDDFEEMELHSTILIDKQGRVHWARTGGDPFSDVAFLTKQLERMNQ
jgi:peroxiredoxin